MLHLHYKSPSSIPLEVEGVTPEALRNLPLAEIEKLEVFQGNRKIPLAEFFRVEGDPADGQIEWEGELAGVHWIGAKMKEGVMRLSGGAGRHLGSEMTGGEIHVEGDAGDWVGGEMHSGLIHVHGRAGHLVGAAYRGSARGMTGGVILIDDAAGNEIGHTMRRGLIAVGGDIGDLAGFNMLAGSILLFGESGIRYGAGMRRGTLGFFGPYPPPLLPSFRLACQYRPDIINLVLRELKNRNFPPANDPNGNLFQSMFDLYHGDMIEGGRGEVWIRV